MSRLWSTGNTNDNNEEAADDLAKEKLRNIYRMNWNLPGTREALARGSHLMLWGDDDLANGNIGALKVSREVYQEYQRQLWDPSSVDLGVDVKNESRFERFGDVGIFFLDVKSNRLVCIFE